ncbi:MAG: hypothetical protein V1774_01590 [Candidatus Eisenbacteria bacterium]
MKPLRIRWGPFPSGVAVLWLVSGLSAPATAEIHIVRPDGSGDYPTIQEAVDAASAGDFIELAAGTFTGPGNRGIQVPDLEITIRSEGGNPDQCIIDCEDAAQGFYIQASDAGTVLQGFTVTRGHTNETGGGMHISGGLVGATVADCVFLRNSAGLGGGGVWDASARANFLRCRFIENASPMGGAVVASSTQGHLINPGFEDCEFIRNSASGSGAAVFLEVIQVGVRSDRDGVFRTCLFAENSAPGGSCVTLGGTSPTLESCTFANNIVSSNIGCRFYGGPSDPLVSHCIIAFSTEGRAVSCDVQSQPVLLCCDVFGNEGGDWVGCLEGQLGVGGNIWADPLFCDREGGDFRLEIGSPCGPEANRNCGLIGALPVGCGSTATQETSWGGVKALFRGKAK